MDLLDIAIAKQLAGGGGGSGTDNYNDLSNLPKINDTTLSGNKTSANLGLQSEINSDSKLASDLVDDTDQDNKFVTSTEKNTWNAKQNAIDSDHKLSSSLVSFSTAEAAALASGIDSSKVGQISTNQTNILYTLGKTGKNLVNPELFTEGGYISDTNDGIVNVSNTSVYMDYLMISPNTEYFITSVGSSGSWGAWYDSNKNFISGINAYGMKTSPANAKYIRCTVSYNNINPNYATTFMICTKADYDESPDYQPYRGLPNYDLTRLEAEDRASLAEVVDSGAKNLLDTSTKTIHDMTFTKGSDEYVTVSPNTTDARSWSYTYSQYFVSLNAGKYVLVVDIKTASSDSHTAAVRVYGQTSGELYVGDTLNNKTGTFIMEFTMPKTENCGIMIKQWNGAYRYMLCTKAAFGVSNKFVPYRPNYDLVCDSLFPTSYTPITAASAVASKISNIIGGYAKIGKLVLINIRFTVTDTITTADLFTVPSAIRPSLVGGQAFGNGSMINVNSNETVPLVITTRDTVTNIGLPVSNTTPATNIGIGTYCISITYLGA